MNTDDFRYMRRGKQLTALNHEESVLLEPINQRGSGKERALLLLHGFSSSPAVYRYLIPQITHYDAIVCPLLPGHGLSIEAFSHSKALDWLSTAIKTYEELIKEYKRVDVLGLSLGGLLACELSQRYTLNHLFLLAPALQLKMHMNVMLMMVQVLRCLGFHHLRNTAGNILTGEHAEITYRKLPIDPVIEMLSYAKHYQWVAPTCPVDLFLGAQDQVVSSEQVEPLFASLPNASIHWLKNSAHLLPLDGDLQEIVACINQKSS